MTVDLHRYNGCSEDYTVEIKFCISGEWTEWLVGDDGELTPAADALVRDFVEKIKAAAQEAETRQSKEPAAE
jgi:hypothetical protein